MKTHSFILKTQFIQVKDEFNYGLVYNGVSLIAGYELSKKTDKNIFTFTPELGFGVTFSKGAGFAWRFTPVDFFYGVKAGQSPLIIGAYLATDYQWQQYSELQGGRLFWFSTIEIGPKLLYTIPTKSNIFEISFSNSLAGFTSRPEPGTETYFYEFNISEFASTVHQNITFGSYNVFNRTFVEIEVINKEKKRLSFGYQFEYFDYLISPRLTFMNHSINLKWKLGKI
jgi:hypothetical protein